MLILSIESSCDETAAAVTRDGREILSDIVVSQADMHALYGGVVPEIASRKHIESVYALAETALNNAGVSAGEIDAVAATFAPGLIGALLVGLNFAKSFAFAAGKPLVPVHHIRAHVAAGYLAFGELEPPFLALVASGGHSLILGVDGYTDYRIIGSTRDDAAGEAFDKVARVLGLGYPGGRAIDELGASGDENVYALPRSKVDGAPYDMSFSGLKTAVINIANTAEQRGEALDIPGMCASFNRAVSDELVPRAIGAAREFSYKTILLAGGVAANSRLRRDMESGAAAHGLKFFAPPVKLCGDAAAMVGAQGYYEFMAGHVAASDLNAFATLPVDYDFESACASESGMK